MSQRPKAVKTFLVFVHCPERLLSRLIVRITGHRLPDYSDRWNHMALGFELSDGALVYYESLFGRKVEGPKSLTNLTDWAAESPSTRQLAMPNLPLTVDESERCRVMTETWVGTIGYAEWQLVTMWLFERLGIPVPLSPFRVVCSELAARAVKPFRVDLTDAERPTEDYVNPNSAWRKLRVLQAAWAEDGGRKSRAEYAEDPASRKLRGASAEGRGNHGGQGRHGKSFNTKVAKGTTEHTERT